MILAHLPAGYLLSRALLALPGASRLAADARRRLLTTGMIASVLPDIDLIYFYLISDQRFSHRAYPTHWPLVWLGIFLLAAVLAHALRQREWHWHNLLLLANVQLHFVLDTIAGQIRWFAPFDYTRYIWLPIPRHHDWWYLDYLTHVGMMLEIVIMLAAWLTWRSARQARKNVPEICGQA